MKTYPIFKASCLIIAGLIFGFMFWRVKSYIAVGTAHSVFGVWAIFVIGIPR